MSFFRIQIPDSVAQLTDLFSSIVELFVAFTASVIKKIGKRKSAVPKF